MLWFGWLHVQPVNPLKIIQRVSMSLKPALERDLIAAGFDLNAELYRIDGTSLASLDVAEDDPRWPAVQRLEQAHRVVITAITEFTAAERDAAELLVMWPSWRHGYPQPEDDYVQATADLSNYCRICGAGAIQFAPFRIEREPKWGRNSILQLNSVYDEYFVRPETWAAVFQPFGIESIPVLHAKTGAPLTTVVQLEIARTATVPLDTSGLPYEMCVRCERKKYRPVTRGTLPAFRGELVRRADLPHSRVFRLWCERLPSGSCHPGALPGHLSRPRSGSELSAGAVVGTAAVG